jgi:hypothetical protein
MGITSAPAGRSRTQGTWDLRGETQNNTLPSTPTMMESSWSHAIKNSKPSDQFNLPMPSFRAEENSAMSRITTWIEALLFVRLVTFALTSYASGLSVKYCCNFLNTAAAIGLVAMMLWRLIRSLPFTWRSLDYVAFRLRNRNQTMKEGSCASSLNCVYQSAQRLPSECPSNMENNCGIIRSLFLRIRRSAETIGRKEKVNMASYESAPGFDGVTDTETDSEREVLLNRSAAPQNVSIERGQDGRNDEAEIKYGVDRDKNC